MLLDISVQPPSDSEQWFKYLSCGPDIPSNQGDLNLCKGKSMKTKFDDLQHGWISRSQNSTPMTAIYKAFDGIMDEGPFDSVKKEDEWWQQLPLVPAVTGVLLRQQTRRIWKPTALALMFARLPRLQEICYQPWRWWSNQLQSRSDQGEHSFIVLYHMRVNCYIMYR